MEEDEKTGELDISQLDMDRDREMFDRIKRQRMCRYCEITFVMEKKNQRFHNSRCGTLYTGGNIHLTTLERWRKDLTSALRWNDGDEETDEDGNWQLQVYPTPQNFARFDVPRVNLYLTIEEIKVRAEASNPVAAAAAWRVLAESLIELWKLPENVDLFGPYNCDSSEKIEFELGFNTRDELPARGMQGLKELTRVFKERWRKTTTLKTPQWWDFINL